MNSTCSKYIIKIPSNTTILYCEKKKTIVIIGLLRKKMIKLKLKLKILASEKLLLVSSELFTNVANNEKKRIKSLRGTTLALLKQVLIETSSLLFQKLKIIGVGYRVFLPENYDNQLSMFKLGFSHSIYFRVSPKLKLFCLKSTKLFIFGESFQNVSQIAAIMREFRKPEPYKGKGVLYENEKIKLKEGKKV